VVICFLTVGFQTAVNATAGAVRMPLRRYLPAVTLGGAIWALVYATVGLAAIHAWLAAAVRWPGTVPITVVVVGAVVALLVWRHRRRRAVSTTTATTIRPTTATVADDGTPVRAGRPVTTAP
ncbi:MAG TPA: hypothetical protein VK103_00820, partial [Bacillota bacterium]|nr:hypothetical protein [Bacillota bacterium]